MKSFIELQEQWNRVSNGSNWRGYLSKGNELEDDFIKSGKEWVTRLILYLSNFNISLKNKTIVELGCGAGRMTGFFYNNLCRKIYALDISDGMLQIAIKRLNKIGINFLISTHNFSFIPNSSIDLIFSVAVFQHMSEKMVKSYFKDSSRILKEGHYFVFQIPIAEKHKTISYQPEPAVDMTYWTLEEIKELAKENNYSIINIPKDTASNGNEYFIFKKK